MYIKTRFILSFLLISLVFSSCDQNKDFKISKLIENESDYDFWLVPQNGNANSNIGDSILVTSNSSFVFEMNSDSGEADHELACSLFPGETDLLQVKPAQSLSFIGIPIENPTYWLSIQIQNSGYKGGEYECTRTITNSDFE